MHLSDRETGYVELADCAVKAVTERAVLIAHGGRPWWIPRGVIRHPERLGRGAEGVGVEVEEAFARAAAII